MDQIRIDNLKVFAHHGVYQDETENGQDFYLNAVLYTNTRNAGMADDLELSTNYGTVCLFMDCFMKEHTYLLIETVVEQLAQALLLEFPLIQELDLEIRKPQAPIPLPFESVSVKIHRGWHKAYVSFGSNMGERKNLIETALQNLQLNTKLKNFKISSLIETEPYGGVEQGNFLNGVFSCDTLYTPIELLRILQEQEQVAHRKREIHWGPRTLDLDVLFYDQQVIDDKDLKVPHPDLKNRTFVLEPMVEIAPNFVHPIYQMTMKDLLDIIS